MDIEKLNMDNVVKEIVITDEATISLYFDSSVPHTVPSAICEMDFCPVKSIYFLTFDVYDGLWIEHDDLDGIPKKDIKIIRECFIKNKKRIFDEIKNFIIYYMGM